MEVAEEKMLEGRILHWENVASGKLRGVESCGPDVAFELCLPLASGILYTTGTCHLFILAIVLRAALQQKECGRTDAGISTCFLESMCPYFAIWRYLRIEARLAAAIIQIVFEKRICWSVAQQEDSSYL